MPGDFNAKRRSKEEYLKLEAQIQDLVHAGSRSLLSGTCPQGHLDFGDRFHNVPNASVSLHLFMSVCFSSAPLHALMSFVEGLAAGSMVDITPDFCLGHPQSLHPFHQQAMRLGLQVPLVYVKKLRSRVVLCEQALESPSSTYCGLAVLISVQDQHCMLAPGFSHGRHAPRWKVSNKAIANTC